MSHFVGLRDAIYQTQTQTHKPSVHETLGCGMVRSHHPPRALMPAMVCERFLSQTRTGEWSVLAGTKSCPKPLVPGSCLKGTTSPESEKPAATRPVPRPPSGTSFPQMIRGRFSRPDSEAERLGM